MTEDSTRGQKLQSFGLPGMRQLKTMRLVFAVAEVTSHVSSADENFGGMQAASSVFTVDPREFNFLSGTPVSAQIARRSSESA